MSRPLKVYIAGPMTGLPDYNFPAFFDAAAVLAALGHIPNNPAENDGPTLHEAVAGADRSDRDWHSYMRQDVGRMLDCDAVVMLSGWQASKGAHLEWDLAHKLGLKVYPRLSAVSRAVRTASPLVVGLGGYAGAGKDTAAQGLVAVGFQRIAFADQVRSVLAAVDPQVNGNGMRLSHAMKLPGGWDNAKRTMPEVRRLLQELGMAVRTTIGVDAWVDAGMALLAEHRNAVFTDVRFPNEMDRLRALGARLVWIDRPGFGPVNAHASEHSVRPDQFDLSLVNDGDTFALHRQLRHVVGLGEL